MFTDVSACQYFKRRYATRGNARAFRGLKPTAKVKRRYATKNNCGTCLLIIRFPAATSDRMPRAMKITFTNQAFSVPSSGGRRNLISPTTRLIKKPKPPEGGTLNTRVRQSVLIGIVLCHLALNAFAQTPDLNGRAVNPFESAQPKAIVLLFIRTDCPISNRYAPELQRLQRQFRDVRFWLVYPNDEVAAIERHVKEYGYDRAAALRDPQHALVKLAGAQVTPEAAVFVFENAKPRLIYRGRIDDRVIAFGKQRAKPAQRELEATLNAVSRGAKLSFKEQPAVGCDISKTDEK